MAAWNQSNYGNGTGQYPGLTWNAIDSSMPLSGVERQLVLRDPAHRLRLGHQGQR